MSIPKIIGKILLISDSSSIGETLRSSIKNTVTEVVKQTVDKLHQIDKTITALDVNTYFNGGNETKSEIKDFLISELNNNKVVAFFTGNGYIDLNVVYKILNIETQRKVIGDGKNEWTTIPVVYSTEGAHWQSRLILYLRRTDKGQNTTSPITKWQGTSHLVISVRPGITTSFQLESVKVGNEAHTASQLLSPYEPPTTSSTSSRTVSVSGGVNSQGVVNSGWSHSFNVTYQDVTVIASPNWSQPGCVWTYTISPNTPISLNGGNVLVQQILFERNSVGNAKYGAWYDVYLADNSGCSKKQATIIPSTFYYVEAQDMSA